MELGKRRHLQSTWHLCGENAQTVISLRALTEVSEVDGTQVFTVNKKLVSMRPSYMIKDVEGRLLGRTNRKILTLFRPKLWLEDSEGRKLLEAKGTLEKTLR